MFACDSEKHAYIADLSVGTYRQMVMSAEACKVAIIHPGLPWNQDELGLEDLLTRAAPFN